MRWSKWRKKKVICKSRLRKYRRYYDLCPECMAKLEEFLKGADVSAKV